MTPAVAGYTWRPASPRHRLLTEITRDAILESVRHPRAIDLKLVDAQEARRVLDVAGQLDLMGIGLHREVGRMLLQLEALTVQHNVAAGVLRCHPCVLRFGRAVRKAGFGGPVGVVLVDTAAVARSEPLSTLG